MLAKTVRMLSTSMFLFILGLGTVHAQTAVIGGHIYTGANDGTGPVMAPAADPLHGARVMVQKQSGGAFITYGTVFGNFWEAVVPAPGDYVVMFAAPEHDCTSREFTVQPGDNQSKDAYLPPLPLPLANLLVYTFYDNAVNGEDDQPDDPPLNGVTVKAWDKHGNLLATGVTGTQPMSALPPGGEEMTGPDGFYYFTGLPPGEIHVTSDASTAYQYDVNGWTPLPVMNPITRAPLDFDETTEFYLLSSEEGGRVFDVVLFPGDPGTEEEGYLVWHGFVEKLGQITWDNVIERFGVFGTIDNAGSISGRLADADQGWEVELYEPGEPPDLEPPEALISALHPGVSANTIVPDGLVVLHVDMESIPGHPVATVEADSVTGEFVFHNVPPGRYRMFCCDVPIDYVYVQQQVTVLPGQDVIVPPPGSELERPGIMVPRFFGRAQGRVIDSSTEGPIAGAEVRIRLKDGSIWKREVTDAAGGYRFDDLPEVEVMAYVDVELPAGYRGAFVTDTFYPHATWVDTTCNPSLPDPDQQCVTLGTPYDVTHNAMNRYIQWYTANYRADLILEPIPAATGDIGGFVFYDHLATGTWVGDGVYDEEKDRTLHGVTVELRDAAGTTLLATTTTGKFNEAATLAQGWMQPYTMPLDEWGGVFVGPLPGFYEFRDLVPGEYTVVVIPPDGFSPAPVAAVTVAGGARTDLDFGINTLVPLAGEIEGGVWDDLFVDPRPLSLMWMEKAGIDGVPVGIYDHLGYFLGAGYQGNPMCYGGADQGPDPLTQCPMSEPLGQKPEVERRVAPTTLLYLGNDPSLPGHSDEYLPLMMPYALEQGKYKFEADWSLVPVSFGQGPVQAIIPPFPDQPRPSPAPLPAPVIHNVMNVMPLQRYSITGGHFGSIRGFSTITLSGRELYVTSWSDTRIDAEVSTDPISGPMIVTTHAGPSNAVHVEIAYEPERALYMAERSVFVDASATGAAGGSRASPWHSIGEAMDNLPAARPRYVFVARGYYNERVQIKESDIQIIGAGPQETIVDGLGSMQLSIESQGIVGRGPVFFIGRGGELGSVANIMISGLTVTRGSVDDDIGCGIFGDAGNRNIDINTCILDHNGGYYGGAIWLQKTNHDVRIWSNTISHNGNPGGYSGGISVNDEPEYGPHHGEPEHVVDDEIPGSPPGTYEIFNNHIFRNFSPDYGGGIALYEVKDHLIVAGNLIEENHADDHGGAVFFEDCGPIDLYGNIIRRNSNYDDGGAISFEDVTDQNALVRVHHNVIAENWADDHGENHVRGGGIAFDDTFNGEVFNNTIVGNVAAGSKDPVGGAIDSERNGHEYNGTEPLGRDFPPGFSDVKIYSNIIWGNLRLKYDQKPHSDEEDLDWRFGINHVWTTDNFHVDDPAVQGESESDLNSEAFSHVEFNCIDNDEYAGHLGNVTVDPQFVDPASFDWRLAPNSPVGNMGAYADGGGLPDPVGTISPLVAPDPMCNATCFDINAAKIGGASTEVAVSGTFGALLSFDPAIDGVRLKISDGSGITVDCRIPPGSFEPDGDPETGGLRYVGPVDGSNMVVDALLQDCAFTISTTRVPPTARSAGTKMIVDLSVGNVLGRKAFMLADQNAQLTYVREPQFDCCPVQPVRFEHYEHTEPENTDLTCVSCHADAPTQIHAGMPRAAATCLSIGCHTVSGPGDDDDGDDGDHRYDKDRDEIRDKVSYKGRDKGRDKGGDKDRFKDRGSDRGGEDGKDGDEEPPALPELAPYVDSGQEIPWVPMATLRPGIPFSHTQHLAGGRTECDDCHNDVALLSRPRSVIYRVMTMRQCRVCHFDDQVRYDCAACHESMVSSFSQSHRTGGRSVPGNSRAGARVGQRAGR